MMVIINTLKSRHMGVLRKLTDEYFEKTLRREDGKYIDVMGCRVITKGNDEIDFLNDFSRVFKDMLPEIVFTEDAEGTNEFDIVEFGGGQCCLLFETYETFTTNSKGFNMTNISEAVYGSFIKLAKHVASAVDVVYHRNNYYYVLADETEIARYIEDPLHEANMDTMYNTCMNKMRKMLLSEFEDRADITREDIGYRSIGMTLEPYYNSDIQFWPFIYVREMKEWVGKTFKEIEKRGVIDFLLTD